MSQNNFDLSNLALQCIAPNNELLYDDVGKPSVMVKIPKMSYAELGVGSSTNIHPAFIIDGVTKDYIWISKYQNCIINNRAYSLPARDPAAGTIDFDTAVARCTAKGAGWHLMTRQEWALLALWCKKNGFMPYGNNDYGKDTRESTRYAVPTYYNSGIARVATGTGPLKWSHDGSPSGIWDLNGNVWEWVGGMRLVYGELQVFADNNAAVVTADQSASSGSWKAIDATTGGLVTPNGSGTTANSIKLDWNSSHWEWNNAFTGAKGAHDCDFEAVTCNANIANAAKLVLQSLGLFKIDNTASAYEGDHFWANTSEAERCFICGGTRADGVQSGVFALSGTNARSYARWSVGFRSAYYAP